VNRTRYVAHAGVIAAVHAAATVAVLQMPAQLGWGPIQFRLSEALTVLALFTPAAIPGLTLGTAVANGFSVAQVGPIGMLDVIFGSLATLLGAAWTWRFRRRRLLALGGPVIANALIVPAYLPVLFAALGFTQQPFLGIDVGSAWLALYGVGVITVGLGQFVVVYGLGLPLAAMIDRTGLLGAFSRYHDVDDVRARGDR
jgi:uncharacterized membrane protein